MCRKRHSENCKIHDCTPSEKKVLKKLFSKFEPLLNKNYIYNNIEQIKVISGLNYYFPHKIYTNNVPICPHWKFNQNRRQKRVFIKYNNRDYIVVTKIFYPKPKSRKIKLCNNPHSKIWICDIFMNNGDEVNFADEENFFCSFLYVQKGNINGDPCQIEQEEINCVNDIDIINLINNDFINNQEFIDFGNLIESLINE